MEVMKLENNLKDIERKNKLRNRWSPSDREFVYYKSLLEKNQRWHLLSSLWTTSNRRKFLLKLKAKYAGMLIEICLFDFTFYSFLTDGQKIAKKLSQQISKETKVVKTLTEELNECSSQPHEELSLADALDPSAIALQLQQLGSATPTGISSGKKRDAIDAYLQIVRSKEEIMLFEKEIKNMIHYYENRDSVIMQSLSNPSQNQCDRGQKALLYGFLQQNSSLFLKIREVYAIVNKEQSPSLAAEESDELTDNEDDIEYV